MKQALSRIHLLIKNTWILAVLIDLLLVSFATNTPSDDHGTAALPEKAPALSLELASRKPHFKTGDSIQIRIHLSRLADTVCSYKIALDNHVVQEGRALLPAQFTWHSDSATVGQHEIQVTAEYTGHRKESALQQVLLLSNIVPKAIRANVLHTFPHDPSSYTQGLLFEHGFVFEGTGIYGQSKLRKVDLISGKVIIETALREEFFGEGITFFKNRIYQLTWKSQQGFIYDPSDFKLVDKFSYPTEGWGLTHDADRLILSDGTENLYFYDNHFNNLGMLSVYDDKGPVSRLNELEYINGVLYANIYQADRIVEIDPRTGKVLARIDLHGLLAKQDYTSDTDVLNGIAWDALGKRLLVTGKNWPKIFEISLVADTKMIP
jgi:glutamine cyclotransferase